MSSLYEHCLNFIIFALTLKQWKVVSKDQGSSSGQSLHIRTLRELLFRMVDVEFELMDVEFDWVVVEEFDWVVAEPNTIEFGCLVFLVH